MSNEINTTPNILNAIAEANKIAEVQVKTPPKFEDVGKILTEKAKRLIFWIGFICTIISAVAYIFIIIVMAVGFKSETEWTQTIVFAIITAAVGLMIAQFLKIQGISFAKAEPEVKEAWEKFYKRKTKTRKYRSLGYFWFKSTVFDIFFKAISVSATSIGAMYVFVESNGEYMRILLALFNLTFFIGFGMMNLAKAYDHTREQHVAWMERKMIWELEKEARIDAKKAARERRQNAVVPNPEPIPHEVPKSVIIPTVIFDTPPEPAPARSYADY